MSVKLTSMRRRIQTWQDRRQPPASKEQLSQRNIYILPTLQSVGYLLALVLLWLVGTNYENNLVLALSYLMMSLFVSAIHATHRNLSGLSVAIVGSHQVFAGDRVTVELLVTNPTKRMRHRLRLRWEDAEPVVVDAPGNEQVMVELGLLTKKRGWLTPDRLHIATTYPIGIFQAWTLPKLQAPMLVFPKPIAAEPSSGQSSDGAEGQTNASGIDEFAGLEPWRPGIPMQRIAWKHYTAGKGLLEKRFEAQSMNPEWLDWAAYPHLDTEARLSALCAQALDIAQLGQQFGLRIPGQQLSPAQGEAHLLQVLTALACFVDPRETMPEDGATASDRAPSASASSIFASTTAPETQPESERTPSPVFEKTQ